MLAATTTPPSAISEAVESRDQRSHACVNVCTLKSSHCWTSWWIPSSMSPDHQLFRSVEVRRRDLGQQVAAAAHQTGHDDRKKTRTANLTG